MKPLAGLGAGVYWIDLIRDGERWTDSVGLRLKDGKLASAAISLVAEFALENTPGAGVWTAEVRTEDGAIVMTATLTTAYQG